jgi:chemotaxis protein MotA
MFFFIGLIVVFVAVLGGYVAAGGKLGPIIKAAPFEFVIIAGAAIGASLVGNSFPVFKAAMAGIGRCISGPKWKPQDYLNLITLVGKLLAVMKREGVVALEAHVENPDSSPIFGEFPKLAKDHSVVQMICDPLRLAVISQGNLDPESVEEIMGTAIKVHHHEAMRAPAALTTIAGSLPALGIVACVLGVVKTMGAIDQPPAVLGALIGAALVGTMLGVFLSYAMFEPFANRLGQIVEEEAQVYKVIQQMIVANLRGPPQPIVIEAARACIDHANQPSFSEVFDTLRGA